MTRALEQVLEDAMALEPDDREFLVEELSRRISPQEQAEIDQAWDAEIDRRITEIDEGKAVLLDGDEVMARLRQRVHG
jgi:putative addiction module component (TIGR02574 family)